MRKKGRGKWSNSAILWTLAVTDNIWHKNQLIEYRSTVKIGAVWSENVVQDDVQRRNRKLSIVVTVHGHDRGLRRRYEEVLGG